MSKASMLLAAAADTLESHGWCQGRLSKPVYPDDPNTTPPSWQFCAIGAIREVHELDLVPGSEYEDMEEALCLLGYSVPHTPKEFRVDRSLDGASLETFVALWNDTPGRTKQQVIQHLRTIAQRIERH